MNQILNIDEIREKINLYLEDDEEIVSEHTSKTGNSYYVSIFTPPNEILNIRISNHPSVKNNDVYSKIDINESKYDQKLKQSIVSNKRKKINYLHYAVLNIIFFSKNNNVTFYVDDSYGTFTNETALPVFYAEYRKKNRLDIINLSNMFSDIMLSLYQYGFLIIYKSQYGKTKVSLTPGALQLMKFLKSKYKDFWDNDSRFIKWWNVDVTNKMLHRNVDLAREEKKKAKERRIKLLRSKRSWIANLVMDIRIFMKNNVYKWIELLKSISTGTKEEILEENEPLLNLKGRISKSKFVNSDKEFKKIEKISVDEKMKEQFSKRSKSKLGNLVDEQTKEKLSKLKFD